MGNQQGGMPGGGPPSKESKEEQEKKARAKKENVRPPAESFGRRKKQKKKGDQEISLPTITPMNKCRLRLQKMTRVKDYLMLEEEFIKNQEAMKPAEDRNAEQREKVDELRGSPMSVGSIEEFIDDQHAIVAQSHGPEYY
eukprot:gene866-1134_t